jgi:hypothetical protein
LFASEVSGPWMVCSICDDSRSFEPDWQIENCKSIQRGGPVTLQPGVNFILGDFFGAESTEVERLHLTLPRDESMSSAN